MRVKENNIRKKGIALLMTAVMALCCFTALAETAANTIESSDGVFSISFQLPEGAKLLSGDWTEDGTLYQANIQGNDGLFFYLAVAAPAAEEGDDTSPVTYNEENGYTDEFLKNMLKELYSDDSESFDTGVRTTAYGTKLAVVRFNDPEAPSAYVFSVWKGYEVGLTLISVDEKGAQRQITDDQVQKVVDFLSEVWMSVDEPAEAPAA